eukprot:TRINITY_DN16619_c0_g1_i1.p1 TRINITY_DN16619_c0_g1~~TRINITY_DN16619_c0_g1_i1.p1  ORF type:complete len:318 (-),score=61.97 TRINITY_DN16619_c0_g1_i1:158-1036(-)
MAYPAPPLSAREPRGAALKSAGVSSVGGCGVAALGNMSRPTNLLLVRDDVGKAKPTTFDLPEAHFAYGRPGNTDLEGAREVSMHWVSHTPSRSGEGVEPNWVDGNRKAAVARVTNAKDLKQFRQETMAPRKGSQSARGPGKPIIPSDVIPGFSYGRKVRPSTPIHEVISARFAERSERQLTEFYSEMRDLRAASQTQVRKIPLTAATRMHANAVRKAQALNDEIESKEMFKLSKFKKVPPKVGSYRTKSTATRALDAQAAEQENPENMLEDPASEYLQGSALAEDIGTYGGY